MEATLRRGDAAAQKVWSAEPEPIEWSGVKRVGLGVDWITGSTSDAIATGRLATWTKNVYRSELKLGGIEKGFGLAGFTGFRVGQLEFGVRDDEGLVRLMSECAKFFWRDVYRLADNLTRLDLQLTYDIGCDPQPLIWNLFAHANKTSAQRKRGPKNDVVLGSDGGATLYCGKRTSNVFGRIYARGPKTKLPADKHLLRFEVQFNKRLAMLVARSIASDRSGSRRIIEQVVEFFRIRTGLVVDQAEDVPNNCLSRSRSDCDKKLLWLSRSVRQSCVTLAERGLLGEVISALGLETFVSGAEKPACE